MSTKPPNRPGRREIRSQTRILMELGLGLSCIVLTAALLLSVYAGPLSAHNVHIHRLIADLYRVPQGVLPVSFLGALIVEDRLG